MPAFRLNPLGGENKPRLVESPNEYDQLVLELPGGNVVVFDVIIGSLKGNKRLLGSYRYRAYLRSLVRCGTQDLNGGFNSAIEFSFDLAPDGAGKWTFEKIAFEGEPAERSSVSPDQFIPQDLKMPLGAAPIPGSGREVRTPYADKIGLQLLDSLEDEQVDVLLEKNGSVYTPVFERTLWVVPEEQFLAPFQFHILPKSIGEKWILRQQRATAPAIAAARTQGFSPSWRDRVAHRTAPGSHAPHAQGAAAKVVFDPSRPAWRITIETPASAAFDSWNTQVASPSLHYFQNSEAESRISGLPRLTVADDKARWSVSVTVQETAAGYKLYGLRPSHLNSEDFELVPAGQQTATLLFEGLTRHDGDPLSVMATLDRPPSSETALRDRQGSTAFNATIQVTEAQVVRIGALDLTFFGSTAETSSFIARHAPPSGSKGVPTNDEDRTPSVQIRIDGLILPVSRVEPGAQDDPPSTLACPSSISIHPPANEEPIHQRFSREAPLLIAYPQDSDDKKNGLSLKITDLASIHESHQVSLSLTGSKLGIENRQYAVIDRAPFMVARVTVPEIDADPNSTQRASWRFKSGAAQDADQGRWQLRTASPILAGVDLPPQVLGEEMVSDNGAQTPLIENRTVDFRFSPPAHVQLRLSRPDESSFPAPWNLRRLFGYPGLSAPGTETANARFELLYGLTTEVAPPQTGEIPLRISELGARFGEVQPCLPAGNDADDYALYWADVYARYQSRVAALELWRKDQPITDELELTEWLKFNLRPSADMRSQFDNDKRMLGGAVRGFEFRASYNAVMRDPSTTTGLLRRPFLSALGGWGFQKATFAGGIVSLYSDTAMGRTSFYSVEELGRISCLWNRAKHVVVYQRTVAPTLQFPNTQAVGRPVIRKVLEYIELLQPRREYPDVSGADADEWCGFINACEFRSKIILVNSQWGSDVLDRSGNPIGFKIPLWKPGADPVVYPRPTLTLEMATQEHLAPDPSASDQQTAPSAGRPGATNCEVLDPEKLFFYSLPDHPVKDIDQWPVVVGVDASPLKEPQAVADKSRKAASDTPIADDPAVHIGYNNFTLSVAAGADRVNLIKGRAQGGINALVRNVTIGRQTGVRFVDDVQKALVGVPSGKLTENYETAVKDLQNLVQGKTTFDQALKSAWDQLVDSHQNDFKALEDAITKCGYVLGSDPCGPNNPIAKKIHDEIDAVVKKLDGATAADGLVKGLFDKIDKADAAALQTVHDRINAAFGVLTQQLTVANAFGIHLISDVTRIESEIADVIDTAKKRAGAYFDAFQASVARSRDQVVQASAKSRQAIVEEARKQLKLVNAAIAPLQGELIADAQRLTAVARTISTLVDAADAHIRPLDNVLVQLNRAALELQDFAETVFGTLLKDLQKAEDDLEKAVAQDVLGNTVTDWADALIAASKKLRSDIEKAVDDKVGAVKKTIDDFIQKTLLDPSSQGGQPWLALLRDAVNHVDAARRGALQQVDECFRSEKLVVDNVKKAILDEFGEAYKLLKKFADGFDTWFPYVCDGLIKGLADALHWRDVLKNLAAVGKNVEDALRGIEHAVLPMEAAFERLYNSAAADVRKLGDTLDEAGGNLFKLLRAFGDVPEVPQLDFNCKQLAYFFDDLKKVNLNGVTALLNRATDELKGLGLRLPAVGLGDHLLPDLSGIKLSDLLPDIGGLKLDNLFGSVNNTLAGNDRIIVTHGIDPQSRQAWVKAQIKDMPIHDDDSADKATLFDHGILVVIKGGRLNAVAEARIGTDAHVDRSFQGSLRGDWVLGWKDVEVVTFKDTALSYDAGGKLNFDLKFSNIHLNDNLNHLSEVIQKISPGSGFSIQPDLPTGIRVNLDLQFPNIGALTSGIQDLTIGIAFVLRAFPEFSLGFRAYFGRRDHPFVMAVFILGGTGWCDVGVTYTPSRSADLSKALALDVDIGIGLSASLQIALGPISGQVGISLAFFLNVNTANAPATSGLRLRIWGEAQILFLISARIEIDFSADYRPGRLHASGEFHFSIDICFFLSIHIDVHLDYTIGEGGGNSSEVAAAPFRALDAHVQDDPFDIAAKNYIAMLEE